jgi:5-methylcytosine-specific restriction endonuclease McrBC GTP-binding regulatory subunit McrB
MNLAAVEHYFSDFLSVIETRRKEDARTITDPLPLDLPSPDSVDPYQSLRGLWLPPNIRIVGTANMDETTRPFSPKVLDRAFSIEFDDVDLTAFVHHESSEQIEPDQFRLLADRLVDSTNPVSVSEVYLESQSFFDRIAGMLEEIRQLLQPAGINFGYRTRDAICLYLWHWAHDKMDSIMPLSTAFDFCVLQKILPKISGTGEALRQGLESLLEWLEQADGDTEDSVLDGDDESLVVTDNVTGSEPARPCPQSADRVRRMLRQLADEGATTYWST